MVRHWMSLEKIVLDIENQISKEHKLHKLHMNELEIICRNDFKTITNTSDR